MSQILKILLFLIQILTLLKPILKFLKPILKFHFHLHFHFLIPQKIPYFPADSNSKTDTHSPH